MPPGISLFSSTLLDNIAFGKPDADEAMIIAAAKQHRRMTLSWRLMAVIMHLLGGKGVRLSGGQRRRIAIARAICKIVASFGRGYSALDAQSEADSMR